MFVCLNMMKKLHVLLKPFLFNFHVLIFLLFGIWLVVINKALGTPLTFWQASAIIGLHALAYAIWINLFLRWQQRKYKEMIRACLYLLLGMPALVFVVVYAFLPIINESMHSPDVPFSWMLYFWNIYRGYMTTGFLAALYVFLKRSSFFQQFHLLAASAEAVTNSTSTEGPGEKSVIVRLGTNLIPIDYIKIAYIETSGNYIKIFETDHNVKTVRDSLNNFMPKLPRTIFFRIHRSFVINLNHIEYIDVGRKVKLKGFKQLFTISRRYYGEFEKVWTKKGEKIS